MGAVVCEGREFTLPAFVPPVIGPLMTLPTVVHGTLTAYVNRKCRCSECRVHWSEYQLAYRQGRRINEEKRNRPIEHGTVRGYGLKCRCAECKAAASIQRKARNDKTIADGSRSHGVIATYLVGCRCQPCVAEWMRYQDEWRGTRLAAPGTRHGNRVTYLCGCRCEDCRAANAAYNAARIDRLRGSPDTPHGTTDGYNSYACRCDSCVAANALVTRDHYIRNRVYFFDKSTKRRMLKATDARHITSRDLSRLLARHAHACAYCGKRTKLEWDHVFPLSRGGRHTIGNLVPACMRCNRSKGARLLIEWKGRPR